MIEARAGDGVEARGSFRLLQELKLEERLEQGSGVMRTTRRASQRSWVRCRESDEHGCTVSHAHRGHTHNTAKSRDLSQDSDCSARHTVTARCFGTLSGTARVCSVCSVRVCLVVLRTTRMRLVRLLSNASATGGRDARGQQRIPRDRVERQESAAAAEAR